MDSFPKGAAPHRLHEMVPPDIHSPLIQKRDVTHEVRRMALWPKNVTLLMGCAKWLSDPKTWRNSWSAPNDPLNHKRDFTHGVCQIALWSKNVTLLMGCVKWPSATKTWLFSRGAPNSLLIQKMFRCLDIFRKAYFWINKHFTLCTFKRPRSARWRV